MRAILVALPLLLAGAPTMAWDGYDYGQGTDVTIERGNLVRSGRSIEVYDWEAGEYRDVDVLGIDDLGGSVEVEVYDPALGETRTFEMED